MEKLLKVQSGLKAPKNQKNTFGNYNYRSCEDILEAVKPLLKDNGLLLTISDKVINIGAYNYIESTARIMDIETKETECVTAYAREADTKKGMDASQITGSTSSYARKYCLNGLFLIDDTKDADTQDNRPTKTEQVQNTFDAKPQFNRQHAIEEIDKAMKSMNYPPEEVEIVKDMVNKAEGKNDFASIYKTIMKGGK